MALFYLELKHDSSVTKADLNIKNQVDSEWFKVYCQLIFHSGVFEYSSDEVENSKCHKRLTWLQFCLARFEYDLDRAVDYLCVLRKKLESHDERYKLKLPNQQQNNRINLRAVSELIISLERTISLNSVRQRYADHKYDELIGILIECLKNFEKSKSEPENVSMKIGTQIEVLLESFWNLERYEECMVWCEKCLKFSLGRFVKSPKNSSRQKEWARAITFTLTYIESLITNESCMIGETRHLSMIGHDFYENLFLVSVTCLGKHYSRLIQSIVRIVSDQLDSVVDKNSQIHPIDTKTPWVILHHVLQREEDLRPKPGTAKATIESNGNVECEHEEEEKIPNSIMIFFTAHEYLGNRGWCTKDKGQLLLFILDVCVPRLRTPYLEQFRDYIAEYLEQVTYCLYAYPAKRARLKHIEEHDAQNIELTWKYAVQLFDLYRPDELPEFNSYKYVLVLSLISLFASKNSSFSFSVETIRSHLKWNNCCSASSL